MGQVVVDEDHIKQILVELKEIKERIKKIERERELDDEYDRPRRANPIFAEVEQDRVIPQTATKMLEDITRVDISALITGPLTEVLKSIDEVLSEGKEGFTEDIIENLGLGRSTVSYRLNLLEKLTLLSKEYIGKRVKWTFTEKGRGFI